ncbi:hypothetical protein NPIL_509841 [Nephila pilipes]|uniref:Uncharacterized protein n=1 Tax=Nephila pilipes TaxID=299642 RepID=A0A8X6PFF8_NEPPI|nr:hypothetical protein NPIL_582741 [Nephila pilipes]GFT62089.1 hypothetical protein NPIL_509841 [Nephila pilipes]
MYRALYYSCERYPLYCPFILNRVRKSASPSEETTDKRKRLECQGLAKTSSANREDEMKNEKIQKITFVKMFINGEVFRYLLMERRSLHYNTVAASHYHSWFELGTVNKRHLAWKLTHRIILMKTWLVLPKFISSISST